MYRRDVLKRRPSIRVASIASKGRAGESCRSSSSAFG
ncbi:unnamed protein product [Acanthoscelides obtectus]|uniref:Uncharacterized protein n=1 Tax=Acanthoscelides obtectus TaxID=200917 RepID=A0A9P0P723_ACAOB|nr:unnamed protein product [Acanthoscelides obtectus]CAK1646949.1 hypothetical protein AOBTE_LOCUS14969 [Acanthoscelides obtectus]